MRRAALRGNSPSKVSCAIRQSDNFVAATVVQWPHRMVVAVLGVRIMTRITVEFLLPLHPT
jgi:hypothetical protein